MDKKEIKSFLGEFEEKKDRTIVIIDFGNVDKWKESLGWSVGIKELGNLIKHFSTESKFLRRFYFGSDYGEKETSQTLSLFSSGILQKARMSGFDIVTKRVRYIHSKNDFKKKCDLDVEMTVDLIRERENYDTIILFSGDGDLMYAVEYLYNKYDKNCFVFGARNHVGREVFDAKNTGVVKKILFAEDFEYRLILPFSAK